MNSRLSRPLRILSTLMEKEIRLLLLLQIAYGLTVVSFASLRGCIRAFCFAKRFMARLTFEMAH